MGFRDDLASLPMGTPLGDEARPVQGPPAPGPTFGQQLTAQFRQSNLIASAIADRVRGTPTEVDPDFDLLQHLRDAGRERDWETYVKAGAFNARRAMAVDLQIAQEEDDRRTIATMPWWLGLTTGIAANLTDPTVLLPVGGAVRATTGGGYAIARSAAITGSATGAAIAVQEGALQDTQLTRGWDESLMNVGSGVILGALLGGGVAAWLNRGDRQITEAAARAAYGGEVVPPRVEGHDISSAMANLQSAGAAVTEGLPLEALRIKGTIAESVAGKFGWLSPNIRLAQSLSPYVRQLAQAIGENPLLMRGHAEGLTAAPGGAASRVASQLEARYPNTIVKQDQIYSDMVRSGQKMSYEDFNQRVGYALLNNTTAIDDNAFITRAAQVWRSEFFDPFLKDMLDSGALSPGNVQMNPGSYLPRQPIAEAFKQYPDEWRRRVVPALEAALMENYQTSLNTARARLAHLEQRRADLRMSAEDAARLIEGLQAQRTELETRAPELALLREVLKDYNAAIRRAAREGNREKVKALRAERDQLREVPGLRAFDEEIRAISARERRLTQSEGMQAQKAQDLADQLADLEERSVAALTRLLERGRATERKLQSLDPEKAQIEIDRLTLAYENVIEREVKSAARLHEQMAKLQEAGEKRMAQARIAADKERAAFTESIDTRKSLKEAREEAEMDKALAERLAKEERRTQARIEEMRRIQARIEAIESVDRMQQAEALREANEMLVRAVAGRQLAMGEKAARLRARIARRDPKWIEEQDKALAARQEEIERRFMERWEVKVLGENVDIRGAGAPKFTQFATDVADELAAKYSGRMYGADGSPKSNFFEVIDKGPFKGRTNPIPDLIMDPPDAPIKFFNKDITEVAHLHARRVAGDIALARLNLGGPALREVFGETGVYKGKLAESYDALRAAVEQAPDAQSAYAALAKEPTILERLKATFKSDDDLTKRKLLKLIADDEANAISDLKLLRDTVRATAFVNENSGSFGRISRVVTGFNYIRQMGGQVISQLTDLYRPAMVRGLLPFLRDGLVPLVTNLAGVKASVGEAKLMNLVTNRASDHILLTMADIGDPLSKLSPIEKIVDKVTRVASRWNGARIWQDFVETIGATMTQTHIMRVLRDPDTMKANTEYLTSLGLNPAIAERVAEHLRKHGEWQGGVGIANTQKWTEGLTGDALRGVENDVIAYRSAVAKEVDGMFSTRRAQPGAIPFFAQTPMGKILLQFNSFNISSLTNVTIRGLQGDALKLAHALVAMTTIGMAVRYIQALHGGQERFDRFRRNIEQNPGFWIAEALDANGMFAVPFWGANMLESAAAAGGMGRINPIKTPIMAMFGPVPAELQSTAAGRDVVTALGGPTAGLISNIPRALGASVQLGLGDSPSKQQSAALQQVLPGGTYIGMRQLLQALNDDLPRR